MRAKDLAKEMLALVGENDEGSESHGFLDTGYPPLNHAISGRYDGGFPMGRMVEMFGPPSAGKTAIATMAMISAQRAGGIAMFNDHERAFHAGLGENLGLDLSPGQWVYKQPKTFEESIDLAVKMITTVREKELIDPEAPMITVFDSLAAMLPKSKADKDAADFNMNDNTALARATSASFPALASFAEDTNTLMLWLNQARTKIGVMFGDPTTTPGGNAPEFYCSVRVKLGRQQIKTKEGKHLGQKIGAQCVKNKVHRPFEKASWNFMFREDGTGHFDVVGSMIDQMLDDDLFEKSGNYIVWDGKKMFKKQLAATVTVDDLMAIVTAKTAEAV